MEVYQVVVVPLSTSHSLHFEVRLIHMSLLLDLYFQFNHWVYCEYLSTPICPDQINLQSNRGHVHIGGQRKMCHKQPLWEVSKLKVELFCVVDFIYRKWFLIYPHFNISLNKNFSVCCCHIIIGNPVFEL